MFQCGVFRAHEAELQLIHKDKPQPDRNGEVRGEGKNPVKLLRVLKNGLVRSRGVNALKKDFFLPKMV